MKLYQVMAYAISVQERKFTTMPDTIADAWSDYLDALITEFLPSGSGIDRGNELDLDKSTSTKLVINASFHVMDENGYYAGWIDYTLTVKPSFLFDIDLSLSFHGSRDKNQLKDYLYELYRYALTRDVPDHGIVKYLKSE